MLRPSNAVWSRLESLVPSSVAPPSPPSTRVQLLLLEDVQQHAATDRQRHTIQFNWYRIVLHAVYTTVLFIDLEYYTGIPIRYTTL